MPLNPNQFEAFVDATNTGGGATMHLATGELIGNNPEGPHGYIIGKEPRRKSPVKAVKTKYVARESFTPGVAQKKIAYIRRLAKPNPDLGVGSWVDTEEGENSPVEMDAVRIHPNLKGAMETARARGEKAVWSTKLQDEIRTKSYFADPKKYHDMVGESL